MVTINPAKQLGVDNRVGSIEVGKDADIVIYDKDPLSNFSKVQKVLIDGNKYFDRDSNVSDRPSKDCREAEADREGKGSAAKKPRVWTEAAMKTFGILIRVCAVAACGGGERYVPDSQRRRLSGDRRRR